MIFAVLGVLGACDDPVPDDDAVLDTQTMIPHASWDCGLPKGIPAPANGQLVFEANMTLGQIYDMGQTQYGRRHLIEIKGGTVSGPDINAQIMTGGLDFQLTLANGALEIEQIMVLKTDDGKYIYFRNAGTGTGQSEVRVVPDFEAANSGDYAWLNTGSFAGVRVLDMTKKTLKVTIYDVGNITIQPNAANAIRVTQPSGVPDQSWECRAASASETQGAELYKETVGIGSGLSVGSSKRGRRNIIPITGGTATGKIAGKVLAGGADFQILSSPMSLDARYTIQTNEGELIIVRNCGPTSSMVPVFEARADGKYGYLNDALWLSSAPSIGASSVALTIYESNGGSGSSSSSSSSSGGCN
ncbi:MAG: DUF3237 family protein [Desulfobacterales bacterium]|nr:DUF3237 family protein [Desulfobacterales bacterium]